LGASPGRTDGAASMARPTMMRDRGRRIKP
jgi:hypothetical protein